MLGVARGSRPALHGERGQQVAPGWCRVFPQAVRELLVCGGTKAHARLALRVIDHSRYQAIRDEIRRERELI